MVKFARIDRLAAGLMIPYQFWVTFATALNAAIWWLNRNQA
jgi:tryptophan-rich sensory protein